MKIVLNRLVTWSDDGFVLKLSSSWRSIFNAKTQGCKESADRNSDSSHERGFSTSTFLRTLDKTTEQQFILFPLQLCVSASLR